MNIVFLYALMIVCLVVAIRFRRKARKKKKRKNTPEDVFLRYVSDDLWLYGQPRFISIRADFWKRTNKRFDIGVPSFLTKHGAHTVSIIYTNGNRKDYDYKGGLNGDTNKHNER